MKVLIVGEGKHELGGALETLVRRLMDRDIQCDVEPVKRNDIHAHHGRGQGYFKKALRWVLEARRRNYDAVVLLIDEDGKAERVRELTQAQEDVSVTAMPRALGVAIRTFDAWMLADESTLGNVLGLKVGQQRKPESLTDPKAVFRKLLDCSVQQLDQATLYRDIMVQVDLALLSTRCPRGFASFAGRVKRLSSTAADG